MSLASIILKVFRAKEDSLRAWVSRFGSDVENSIYWKQSLSGIAYEVEEQLINHGHVRQRRMWIALANATTGHIDSVWETARTFGVTRPASFHGVSTAFIEPRSDQSVVSETTTQAQAIVRALLKRKPYGRQSTFDALDQALHTLPSGRILLVGPTGYGKSTVLAHWGAELVARNYCVAQHFFNRSYEASTSVSGAYTSLRRQLGQVTERAAPSSGQTRTRDWVAALLSVDRPASNRLVVILDGLDEADEPIEPFSGLGESVFVVASVRTAGSGETLVAKPWMFMESHKVELKPLEVADIEDWVQTTVPPGDDVRTTAERLLALTSGVPIELRFVLDDLGASSASERRRHIRDVLDNQPSVGFVDYCRRQLHHLEAALDQTPQVRDDRWPAFVLRLFALLVFARGPVPEEELASVLGIADATTLHGLPNAAARWLAFVPKSGISFDSARLATIFGQVIEQSPGMHIHAAEARRALVEHCLRWHSNRGRYALTHLPGHLIHEQRPAEAQRVLLDVSFLRARLAVDEPLPMIRKTVEDYVMLGSEVPDTPRVNRMATFWSMHASLFAAHLESFGQTHITEIFDQLVDDLRLVPTAASPPSGWRIRAGLPDLSSPALRRELKGHDGAIKGAVGLPDGRLLSWSVDRTLRVWSPEGADPQVLAGHAGGVTGAIAVGDDRILSWGHDPALRLWRRGTERPEVLQGHQDWVQGGLELSDGHLLSWSHDGTLRVWSGEGEPRAPLVGHRSSVVGALELAERRILSWSQDGTLCIWKLSGDPYAVLEAHTEPVLGAMQLSDDRVVSWSQDGTACLWTSAGTLIGQIWGGRNPMSGLERSSNGDLIGWSFAGELQIFAANGALRRSVRAHDRWMAGATVLADESILTWSYDNTIRWWHDDGEPKAVLAGHTAGVRDVLVVPGGRGFLSWADDGSIRLWGPDGSRGQVLYGQIDWGMSGARLLAEDRVLSWGQDGVLRVWSTLWSGRSKKDELPIDGVEGCVQLGDGHLWSWGRNGAMSLRRPDGSRARRWPGRGRMEANGRRLRDGRLLTWSSDGTLSLWSVHDDTAQRFRSGTSILGAIEPVDGRILTWGNDADLQVWSADGRHAGRLEGHSDEVKGAIELADGTVVSWSGDRTVRMWSPDGRPIALLHHPYGELKAARQLPGGGFVSWGNNDPRIFVWDHCGNHVRTLVGHEDGISEATVLRGGALLSISLDRTLRLWRPDGAESRALIGHDELIAGALQLKDGRILSWSDDRTLRIWSEAGQVGPRFEGHIGWIQGAFEQDSSVLSYGQDGTLRRWTTEGRPVSMWVSPGRSRIQYVGPHAQDPHLFWIATQRDVVLVARRDLPDSSPYNP